MKMPGWSVLSRIMVSRDFVESRMRWKGCDSSVFFLTPLVTRSRPSWEMSSM